MGPSPLRKRPQTAGRMRVAQPATDLFNNKFISQQVLGDGNPQQIMSSPDILAPNSPMGDLNSD